MNEKRIIKYVERIFERPMHKKKNTKQSRIKIKEMIFVFYFLLNRLRTYIINLNIIQNSMKIYSFPIINRYDFAMII